MHFLFQESGSSLEHIYCETCTLFRCKTAWMLLATKLNSCMQSQAKSVFENKHVFWQIKSVVPRHARRASTQENDSAFAHDGEAWHFSCLPVHTVWASLQVLDSNGKKTRSYALCSTFLWSEHTVAFVVPREYFGALKLNLQSTALKSFNRRSDMRKHNVGIAWMIKQTAC